VPGPRPGFAVRETRWPRVARRPRARGARRGAEATVDPRPGRSGRGAGPDEGAVPRPPDDVDSATGPGALRRASGAAAGGLRPAPGPVPARGDVGALEGRGPARVEPHARARRAIGGRGRAALRRAAGHAITGPGAAARPAPAGRGDAAVAPLGAQPAHGGRGLLPVGDAVVGAAAVRGRDRVVPVRLHPGRPRGPVRRGILPGRPGDRAGPRGAAAVPAEGRAGGGPGPGRDPGAL